MSKQEIISVDLGDGDKEDINFDSLKGPYMVRSNGMPQLLTRIAGDEIAVTGATLATWERFTSTQKSVAMVICAKKARFLRTKDYEGKWLPVHQ
mmetsp:Transcript_16630/g.35150  ORF Transcript_16630/g.35150 Transcript_16630/m.35150 type:complete len:94 (-) Transcript_16630:120-401(-)